MGIAPITLPSQSNAAVQETAVHNHQALPKAAVQHDPPVAAVTAQATTALQPTQASPTAVQTTQASPTAVPTTQAVGQVSQGQIQQLFFAGESVSQIAGETGLSVNDVDLELGITTASTTLPAAAPAVGPEPTSTAPTATTTAAIAAYAAVPGPPATSDAGPSTTTTFTSKLSVDF